MTAHTTPARRAYDAAFSVPRDPRSTEYKLGVLAALRYRLDGKPMQACPYRAGTAQSDAWHAGAEEGHRRARQESAA